LPSGHDHVWQADVGTEAITWMLDHKVHGQAVMPGTGFAEMALAAGCEALGLPAERVAVNRVEVEQMLRLEDHTQVTTQLIRSDDSPNSFRVEIHSRSADGNWRRHAVAGVEAAPPAQPPQRPSGVGEGTVVAPADLYAGLRRTGLNHGDAFAALTRIVRLPGGEYIEVHQPVDEYERWKLVDFEVNEPLVVRPNAQGRIPWHQNMRASLSRWFFEDRLTPVTQAEVDAALAHQHHELDHIDAEETAELEGAAERAAAEGRPTVALHDKAEVEIPAPKFLEGAEKPETDEDKK
jgi:acyl transferase domain-containing protein